MPGSLLFIRIGYNEYMEIHAYAKINLTLDVLRLRDDGYHELATILHTVDLFDSVFVEKAEEICVTSDVPLPPDNTAFRAAKRFLAHMGIGARIHMVKRIPCEAGLGGGSADAAAVLVGMNALCGGGVSLQALLDMGKAVGADVPFCLLGGCALAKGIGEILSPLPHMPMDLLIVKGPGGVSTRALFQSLRLPVAHPDTETAAAAIRAGNLRAFAPLAQNALEPAACAILPEIAANKRRMLEADAIAAFMTGSGAAVAGIFESKEAAKKAAKLFCDLPFARVCRTVL